MLTFIVCMVVFVSIFLGCQKNEYDNPYDSSVDMNKWAPKNLTISQTSLKTAILKWTQTEPRIDSFCIETKRGDQDWKVIGYSNKSVTEFIDSSFIPDPNTPIQYRVRALAWKNNSGSANNSLTPVFNKPYAPFAIRDQGVKIKVSISDIYVNEDSYKIEKKVDGGKWVLCTDTLRGNSTVYYDTSPELNANISYRISVKAAGIYSDTTSGNRVSTLISSPGWFTIASLSQTSCRLNWMQGDNWTTGYNIDRQIGNNPWQDGWLKLDSSKTTFTDNNIPTDQDVKYRVSTMVRNSLSAKTELIYGLAQLDSITTSNPTCTSVKVASSVKSESGIAVTEWGIVYGTNPNPTVADSKFIATTAVNVGFSTTLTGIDNTKIYYIRSYAINRRGESYGKQTTFKPIPYVLPQLDVTSSANIHQTYVELSSYIKNDGGASIIESGFVCSKNPSPAINDLKVINGWNYSPDKGVYKLVSSYNDFQCGTLYYVRSYAINVVGVSYGPETTFKTLNYPLPTIDTLAIKYVDVNRVLLSGNLIYTGGDPINVKGFVGGSSVNPTINDKIWTDNSSSAHLSGGFTGYISGLNPNQTYHVRAYSQNTSGVVYSADKSFITPNTSAPILNSTILTTLNSTSASISSLVFIVGENNLIEAGFVYATSSDPTINDNIVQCALNSPGYQLDATLHSLVAGGTYYVRSFARNSIGLSYGPVLRFTTYNYTLPMIFGTSNINITPTSAYIKGGVSTNGGDDLSENGFVYGDNPAPTILDTKVIVDIGRNYGSYYALLTNLQPGHKYYYRGYIKNIKGIVYSYDNNFTTGNISLPWIDPLTVKSLTSTSISLYCVVVSDGGKSLTESGYVYSTISGPTFNDNKVVTTTTPFFTGGYELNYTITGLSGGHTYYIRAFATNSLGTTFGPEKMVVTP